MTTILAIDPGLGGGFAYNGMAVPMPLGDPDVVELIRSIAPGVVYLEKLPAAFQGGFSNQGAVAKLHNNAGVIRGACIALGIRLVEVAPREWQAGLHLGTRAVCKDYATWKRKLRAEAMRRFPGVKVTLKTADALLIWEYAKGKA